MMDIDRMLTRFGKNPDELRELARLSRFLGVFLPGQSTESLRTLRAGLARCAPESEFARGYLRGLRDLLAAFASKVTGDREEEEALQLAQEGDWPGLLLAIDEGVDHPNQLSERLKKDLNRTSRGLTAMWESGLVQGGYSSGLRLTLRGTRAVALIKSSRLDDAGDLKAEPGDGAQDRGLLGG